MTSIDDLYSEIPTQQIAQRLGADENEVRSAVKTLLPVLVGVLQHNAGDPDTARRLSSRASVTTTRLDTGQGHAHRESVG